jgi:hypothetical protein
MGVSLSLSGLVLHAAWATNCNKLVGGLLDPMKIDVGGWSWGGKKNWKENLNFY